MNDGQTRARFESLLLPLMNHAYNLGRQSNSKSWSWFGHRRCFAQAKALRRFLLVQGTLFSPAPSISITAGEALEFALSHLRFA
jgi:hypothetical protein